MRGSFPLPLGKINSGEEELRENINEEEAVSVLRNAGVDLPDIKLQSYIENFPQRMEWLRENGDRFRWRFTTDPWKVFVAEVLLQQTRGDQVNKMYQEFLKRFDSPHKVHAANDEEVRRYLSSLGLRETRISTFNEASDQFVNEDGGVSDSLDRLQNIHGVGQYISRATLLFSFGQPMALYDTNIQTFLEEDFGITVNNSEKALTIMEAITPNDSGMARSLYFWIIDSH